MKKHWKLTNILFNCEIIRYNLISLYFLQLTVYCFLFCICPNCTSWWNDGTKHTRTIHKIYKNLQAHGDTHGSLVRSRQPGPLVPDLINPRKCSVLLLWKQDPKRVYHFDEPLSSQVMEITITQDLKWSTHTAGVVKKVNSPLHRIRKTLVEIDYGFTKTIVSTHVFLAIVFVCIIEDSCNVTRKDPQKSLEDLTERSHFLIQRPFSNSRDSITLRAEWYLTGTASQPR